jgi:hypothetical protein
MHTYNHTHTHTYAPLAAPAYAAVRGHFLERPVEVDGRLAGV